MDATIEWKNVRTKEITKVDVDSVSGKYAVVVTLEREDDFIMKVKKEDYAFTSRYISTKVSPELNPLSAEDERGTTTVKKIDIDMKPIEVGETYRLDHIKFSTNSADVLSEASMTVLHDFV